MGKLLNLLFCLMYLFPHCVCRNRLKITRNYPAQLKQAFFLVFQLHMEKSITSRICTVSCK